MIFIMPEFRLGFPHVLMRSRPVVVVNHLKNLLQVCNCLIGKLDQISNIKY